MTFIPRRKKRERMAHKEETVIRSQSHLQWIRGCDCAVKDKGAGDVWACSMDVQAAHVRTGTDGSTGKKPSDCWTLPLCSFHHMIQHRIGEGSFEREYKIDMKAIATALWRISPAGMKYRAGQEQKF